MRTDLTEWIALSRIPGMTSNRFSLLINYFHSPHNIFKATLDDLRSVDGLNEKIIPPIIEKRDYLLRLAEKDMDYVMRNQIHVMTFQDTDFPDLLKNINSCPAVLYVKGLITAQDLTGIALVGTRNPSPYGQMVARKLSLELSEIGITIISGMARGIDTIAHSTCLDNNGRTIAVMGCGIDVCYPRENKALMDRISHCGAVISEFPMGTPPEAYNFPVRNRIISGLSLGVVVIEAKEKSGALITADYALQQGREVFAIPGNITADTSLGPNLLIRHGAKLVMQGKDIIEEVAPQIISKRGKAVPPPIQLAFDLSDQDRKILEVLCEEPLHIDIICERTGLLPSDLARHLLSLELEGCIFQVSGKRFVKSF
jgi:DNA processing protein